MDHTCEQQVTVEDCGVQPPELPKGQKERKGDRQKERESDAMKARCT